MRALYREELKKALYFLNETPRELMGLRRQQIIVLVRHIGEAILLDDIPFLAKNAKQALEKCSFDRNEAANALEELLRKL